MYAMIGQLSEGQNDVIIPAPNREVEVRNLRPLRSKLPAVWSDISKAMRIFKEHSLHMLVLVEVLELELFSFSRQLKLKPGNDDNHRVILVRSNDLWITEMEIKKEEEKSRTPEALVLRMKPDANKSLYLTPRIAALGMDAFERSPAMITKILAHLVKELNLAEKAEEKSAEFIDRMCQITLETFKTHNVRGEEGFERTDSMLERLESGSTASLLAKVYPGLSRNLIKEFLETIRNYLSS